MVIQRTYTALRAIWETGWTSQFSTNATATKADTCTTANRWLTDQHLHCKCRKQTQTQRPTTRSTPTKRKTNNNETAVQHGITGTQPPKNCDYTDNTHHHTQTTHNQMTMYANSEENMRHSATRTNRTQKTNTTQHTTTHPPRPTHRETQAIN